MDQTQADKTLIIANGHGTGPESLIEAAESEKRNITLFEERVLRCVHHEFMALTQAEAAEELNVSPAKISRTLSDLEERSKTCKPIQIMFPILTRLQFRVYTAIIKHGLTVEQIAKEANLSEGAVNDAVAKLKSKGIKMPKRSDAPRSMSYTPSMDKDVKEKY
jgi:DNA-binding MarR family transcriptional regulator